MFNILFIGGTTARAHGKRFRIYAQYTSINFLWTRIVNIIKKKYKCKKKKTYVIGITNKT